MLCFQVPELDGTAAAHREDCLWVVHQGDITELYSSPPACGGQFVVQRSIRSWLLKDPLESEPRLLPGFQPNLLPGSFPLPPNPAPHKNTKTLANTNSSFRRPLSSDYPGGMGAPTFSGSHFIRRHWEKERLGNIPHTHTQRVFNLLAFCITPFGISSSFLFLSKPAHWEFVRCGT